MFWKTSLYTLLIIASLSRCASLARAATLTRPDCAANQLCEFKNSTDPDPAKRWDALWKTMLPGGVQFTGITWDTVREELSFTKKIAFANNNAVTITFDGPAAGRMYFNIKEEATNNTNSDWTDFHFEIFDKIEGALLAPFNDDHPTKAHLHPKPFSDKTKKNKLKRLDVPGKEGNNGVPKMTALAEDKDDVVPKNGGVWMAETLRLHDIVDAQKKNMQFDFIETPSTDYKPIPEPATAGLIAMAGLIGYGFVRRIRAPRARV